MADDIAPLGFSIDTKPLEHAKQAANDAAKSIGNLGAAVDTLGSKKGLNQWSTGIAFELKNLNANWGEIKKRTDEAGDATDRHGSKLRQLGSILQATRGHVGNLAASMGVQGGGGAAGSLTAATNAATGSLGNIASMLPQVGARAGAVAAGIAVLATAYVGLITVLSSAQDKMASYEARLKNALGGATAARDAMQALSKSANETGISFDSTADAFLRIARNTSAIGASKDEVLQLSSTVQKLGVISGATAGEVASGMLQLSQALASGRLNGDELRSIMENMPALAKAIADGLKISVGELRAMGAAGELTSEKVFTAILAQTEKVNQEFKTMPDTAERAFQRMTDAATKFASRLGEVIAASPTVRVLLKIIEEGLNQANKALEKTPEGQKNKSALDAEIEAAKRLKDIQEQPSFNFFGEQGGKAGAIQRATKAYKEAIEAAEAFREQEAALAASKDFEKFTAERNKALAQVGLGLKLIKEDYDQLGQKEKKYAEDTKTVETALGALGKVIDSLGFDAAAEQSTKLTAMLDILKRKAQESGDVIQKMVLQIQRFAEARLAVEQAGGLPTTDNIQREQRLRDQANRYLAERLLPDSQFPAALAEVRSLDVQSGRQQLEARLADEKKNVQNQEGLTAAMQKGKDAARAYTAQMQAAAIVTAILGQDADKAADLIKALAEQLDKAAKEAEKQGGASRAQGVLQQIAEINAQLKVLERGAYAMREAQALVQSKGPDGLGKIDMDRFYAQEKLQAEQAQYETKQQIELEKQLAAAAGNVAEQKRIQLEYDIKRAQQNAPSTYADQIAQQQQELAIIKQQRVLKEQNAQTQENIAYLRQEAQLAGLSGAQYEIQVAVLQKKRQLLAEGVDLSSEEAKSAISLAAEQAKVTAEIQKQKEAAAETNRIWTRALEGIQSSFADFFTQVFSGGVRTWKDLAGSLKQIFFRTLGEIAAASLIRPVIQPIVALGGATGLIPGQVAQQYGGGGILSFLGLGGGGNGVPVTIGGQSYVPAGGGGGGILSGGFSPPGGGLLSGGGIGGDIGNFFGQTLYGANPLDYAGVIEGLSGSAAMEALGVTPGVTLGGALGGVLGIGSGIFSLAQGNPIGGIAGILGGALSFVPGLGPVGAAIGLLGGLLGGLFGKKKPKTPQAVSDVIFNDAGRLSSNIAYTRGRGGSGLAEGTQKAGSALADAIAQITGEYDLRFASDATGGWILNSIGKNTGNQWIAGLGQYNQPGSSTLKAGLQSAEEAIGIVAGAIFKKAAEEGKISGAGYTDTIATILKNATLESLQDITDALSFGQVYDDLKRGTENITASEQAIRALNKQFAQLKMSAEEYGLDVGIVTQRQQEAQTKIGTDFNDRFRRGLLGMTPQGSLQLQLEDLQKEREQALKEAAYITDTITGVLVDINQLEEYYAKKRQQIIEDANSGIIDSLKALYQSVTYGQLSAASPAATLAGARAEFEKVAAAALGGDSTSAGSFAGVAQQLLEVQANTGGHNAAYGSTLARVRAITEQLLGMYDPATLSGSVVSGSGSTGVSTASAELVAQFAAMVQEMGARINVLLAQNAQLMDQLRRYNAS